MRATTLTYTGAGADLNVATDDGSGNITNGVTTLTIPVADVGVVNAGDSVMVTLAGLQYPYAGDLQVTLTLMDSSNHVLASGDVFNRIGKMSSDPSDPGYDTQFGNSGAINSGDYNFDSGFSTPMTNDLWDTAGQQGAADSIPSRNYWTTSAFSSANNNLSYVFGGLATNGTWVLTITDYYPPTSSFVPGISSWGLTIQATTASATPEPSTAAFLALGLGLGLLWRVRGRSAS